MKKINEGFYEIEPELYAETKEGRWFITDEKSDDVAGPFADLEALRAVVDRATSLARRDGVRWIESYIERASDAAVAAEAIRTDALTTVSNTTGQPEVVVTLESAEDLVTLREAAQFLPVTRQNLEYHRNRGSLKVSPVITGRSTELYSLKQLKEAFPS